MQRRYYRVRPEFSCLPRFLRDSKMTDGIWIANELYTPKEKNKYFAPDNMFDMIIVDVKHIYYFFGARFYSKDFTGGEEYEGEEYER